ncbi:MAG: NAD(P)H-hydrate dehydratase [Myxococcales bacterium]|nr:NAD(P)H-hydrate dehydratase [Myxococcales bacterium]
MLIVSAEQIRQLESRTFSELGLPPALVMDTAGRAIADQISKRLGPGNGRWLTVLAGVGNNGGDGLVVARVLAAQGYRCEVFVAGDHGKMTAETRLHFEAAKRHGGVEFRWVKDTLRGPELQGLRRSLGRSAAIVDALTGLGLHGELREPVLTMAAQLDGRYRALTVSVDLPSGLCSATGKVLGSAVKCHLVVTMTAAKPGLFLGAGPEQWQELVVADIGIVPKWLQAQTPTGELLNDNDAAQLLPARPESGHKGTFGHAFVVAGSPGKGGAAILCAGAALRTGVGLVTLATSGEIRQRLEGSIPDIMVEAVRGGASEAKRLEKLLHGKDAVVVGPGLGTGAAELDLVQRLCSLSAVPVLLDADALTILAGKPEATETAKGRLVLTPHPGEMARLLGCEVAEVTADRMAAATKAAHKWQAVVVLKGERTLIVAPDGNWAICNQPNAALAKGGSGDVLAGIIGSLLAQGLTPLVASKVGVHLHSKAGQLMRNRWGSRGGIASDLVGCTAAALGALQGVEVPELVPAEVER